MKGTSYSHELHQIHLWIVFIFILIFHNIVAAEKLSLDNMSCANHGLGTWLRLVFRPKA